MGRIVRPGVVRMRHSEQLAGLAVPPDFDVVPGQRLVRGLTWANHQRVHQYTGDITESWGGKRISIDQDFLDVQLGTPVVSKSARAGAYRPSGPTLER